MTSKIRRVLRQLSLPLVLLAAALFAVGMVAGYLRYLQRSPVPERQVPGANAWAQQFVVAAIAGALFGYAWWRRRAGRHSDRLFVLAPLGKTSARRAVRTCLDAVRRPSGLGRATLAAPFAALFLYGFFRAGVQVTAGLDPNFTVNAWGGPTYLGAMACHYLDAFSGMAATAWTLDRIMLPAPAVAHGAAPSHAPASGTSPY